MASKEPAGNAAGESAPSKPAPKPGTSDSDSSATPFDAAVIAALMELPTSPPCSPHRPKTKGLLSPKRTPSHASPFSTMAARVHKANPTGPRSPFFDTAFSPLGALQAASSLDEPSKDRAAKAAAARQGRGKSIGSLRAAAEAGRGAPLLPRIRDDDVPPATPDRRPQGRSPVRPSVPAVPKGWISVKIMPSSCELKRAIRRVNHVMGRGNGGDSDSGDENRPPRTHKRQLSLQDLRDAAAAADYPQSPSTNDVGISLLGRLGSPRRLVTSSPNRSPPPEANDPDDDVLHLVAKDQVPEATNVQFRVTNRRRAFSAAAEEPRKRKGSSLGPPSSKRRAPGTTPPTRRPAAKRAPSPIEDGTPTSTKKHKPCNCRNSRCLKLYCDCFAAGRWCKGCNCADCHNDLAHAKERDEAIRATLEKNPKAFRAKVKGEGHASGCHCKKSKCLKKYCECFEAAIHCGLKCKCANCENYEGSALLEARRAKLKGSSRGRSKSPASLQRTASSASSCSGDVPSSDETTASAAFLDLLRSASQQSDLDASAVEVA